MQTIKLDLQQQSILTPLKAKQNDRYSRFFKVVLLDGSTAFSIPQGAALTVRYIAPSGSGWYDTITEIDDTTTHSAFAISGNEVTVELAEAMLALPGSGTLCLQIYTATGYRIGTWNIPLEIEADPLADSTIAASDYYNVLTAQVAQALGYRDAAANSATAAAASAALAQQISQQSKGWFATDTALEAAFPTGQNGWWAIVGAGDNIWTWDADTNAWVNTHTQTDLSNYYTKAQADAEFLSKTATSEDTKKFGGQLPAHYLTVDTTPSDIGAAAKTEIEVISNQTGTLLDAAATTPAKRLKIYDFSTAPSDLPAALSEYNAVVLAQIVKSETIAVLYVTGVRDNDGLPKTITGYYTGTSIFWSE